MPAKRPRSLRLVLLCRLLPATLALLLAGAFSAYWIALGSATKAYDRSLLDTAFAISEQLQENSGNVRLVLTPQARTVLLTDAFDRVYYSIRSNTGKQLDGNLEIPLPPSKGIQWLGSPGRLRYYYDGRIGSEPIRIAALQTEINQNKLIVLVAETRSKRNELVRDILLGMLLPELLLVLVSISVIWFGVRAGLKPLDELRSELADRSQTDLSPVAVEIPDEIQPVVNEINALLKRLENSLISQRNFVSDAAHQLRTPIAALQAQVEAALAEVDEQTQRKFDGVLSATRRMSHLVSQLLVLARTEPGLSVNQPEIDLVNITGDIANNWLPIAIEHGIDLGFELESAPTQGNLVLLEELIGNLIDNALHHTPAGGIVTVACGRFDEQHVFVSVSDSGPGIPAKERDRVFERFYRSPSSNSSGCGLGLAIVAQIAQQHGGKVMCEKSHKLGGAELIVILPLAINADCREFLVKRREK